MHSPSLSRHMTQGHIFPFNLELEQVTKVPRAWARILVWKREEITYKLLLKIIIRSLCKPFCCHINIISWAVPSVLDRSQASSLLTAIGHDWRADNEYLKELHKTIFQAKNHFICWSIHYRVVAESDPLINRPIWPLDILSNSNAFNFIDP